MLRLEDRIEATKVSSESFASPDFVSRLGILALEDVHPSNDVDRSGLKFPDEASRHGEPDE
jgi:hypothetical protein